MPVFSAVPTTYPLSVFSAVPITYPWLPHRYSRTLRGRLFGHTDIICSLVEMPQFDLMASASMDSTIHLWCTNTLTLKVRPPVV